MMSVTYETLTPQSNPNDDDSPITVIHNDDGEEMRRPFFFSFFSPQNSDDSSAYLREMLWDFYEDDDDVWSDAGGYDDDYNDLVPVDDETPPAPWVIRSTSIRMHPDMDLSSEWGETTCLLLTTTIRMCCTLEENADAFVPVKDDWELAVLRVQENILEVVESSNWRERGDIRLFKPLHEECRALLLKRTGIHLSFDMWAFMLDENVGAVNPVKTPSQQHTLILSDSNPFAVFMQEEEDEINDQEEEVKEVEKRKNKRMKKARGGIKHKKKRNTKKQGLLLYHSHHSIVFLQTRFPLWMVLLRPSCLLVLPKEW